MLQASRTVTEPGNKQIKQIDMEQNEKIIKELQEWVNNYPSWLSERTDYARGYKNGIIQAMNIVQEILNRNK